MTESGLQTILQKNDGSESFFYALIKNAATEKEVEVYPCKDDYSTFTANPFLCQLTSDMESVGKLQPSDILLDAISNDNESN